jgi:hypothetical protein
MPRASPWIIGLLLLATGVGWLLASRGPVGTPSHAGCFSHRDCAKGEWCAVEPKADGFASQGQCAEICQTPEQCLNGWRCLTLSEAPEGVLTRRGPGARHPVCVDPKRMGSQ